MNELTECGSYLDGEKIFASESEEKAGTVQRWTRLLRSCRMIMTTDFICVLSRITKRICRCFANTRKNMVSDFGTIFLIPLVLDLLIRNFKPMRNWVMKK